MVRKVEETIASELTRWPTAPVLESGFEFGQAPSSSPMGLGNRSPWSGEPWANHGEPGHGKSGKCPELRDGREVSAGVRVDLEIPGSMA